MTTAEILRAARDLMNHGGKRWTQGCFRKKNHEGITCFCALGAIYEVTKELPKDERGTARAQAVLALHGSIVKDPRLWPSNRLVGKTHGDRRNGIMFFNDHHATRWDDVKEVFSKAARRASRNKTAA